MNWPVRDRVDRLEPGDGPSPARIGTTPTISLAPRDTNEMFGIQFTGFIRIPRTGVYTFTAMSDDGTRLWIGGETVLASLGQSPATTETGGQIALQAGLHPFTVGYFQAYGPMALDLYIEGPGMSRQLIPARMLVHSRLSHAAGTRGEPGIRAGHLHSHSPVPRPPAVAGGNSQHR
jgi:hypothetical protein